MHATHLQGVQGAGLKTFQPIDEVSQSCEHSGGGPVVRGSRRDFLKAAAVFGSVASLGASSRSYAEEIVALKTLGSDVKTDAIFVRQTVAIGPKPTGSFPIMQGATSQTQTQFRILVDINRAYEYTVVDPVRKVATVIAPIASVGVATAGYVIDHVFVDGLQPDIAYELEIREIGKAAILDRRQFSTTPAKSGVGDPLRVALLSCMNDRYSKEQSEMWAAVARSMPEIMIFNGDSCYVDQRWDGTIEGMWTRHVKTRRMLDVFKWDRLVPTYCTWDDHDAGANNGNATNPRLGTARQYFDWMFDSLPVDGFEKSANGASAVLDQNGMRFIFTDCRTAKSDGVIFSNEDQSWIERQILGATGPIHLVSGMQFFGAYLSASDSIEETAPDQLAHLMDIGARAKTPMVLMSGDVHFSEVMALEKGLMGYTSLELTSSSLHSKTFPGHQYRSYNWRRLESTSNLNYLALELNAPTATELQLEVACLGSRGAEFFRLKTIIKR